MDVKELTSNFDVMVTGFPSTDGSSLTDGINAYSPILLQRFSGYDIASIVHKVSLLLRCEILQCVLGKNFKIALKYSRLF
jgi:hypothetical protein